MIQLTQKLRPLVAGSASTVGVLYKHFLDTRTNHNDPRINTLEKSLELQVALNETLEVQIKIVQALLENVQKTLRILTIGMVATATIAAVALAVAVLK